jgi:hypothetical protein
VKLIKKNYSKSVSVPRNDISHQTDSEKSESDKMSTLKAVKDLSYG